MICCIGDSFTFGDELPDVVPWRPRPPSKFAWPAVLGQLTNRQIVNQGKSGCSNSRIVKRAIDATLEKTNDIIIIAWTNPDRYEFVDSNGIYSDWPGRNPRGMMDLRMEWHKNLELSASDTYYAWSHKRWLRDILLLQSFFKANNQKYLMLQSHQSQWHNQLYLIYSKVHNYLADNIDTTYFLGWPSDGIVEWMGDCPQGPGGHPLELGHQRVAEKINEYIRNLGWVS